MRKKIRCGRGLGDTLYLQGVVRHLVGKGLQLTACTDYPEVFRYLPVGTMPFTRHAGMITAHYVHGKYERKTNQFQDCCRAAGIQEDVEFRLDWRITNRRLTDRLKDNTVLIQLPRTPMGRTDGFGASLLPDCARIQQAIDMIDGYKVLVGAGKPLYHFNGIDLDLTNQTSISELLDVAYVAERFIGYCSYMIPLAESFDKKALFIWSRRGLNDPHQYIRSITPQKILSKSTSRYVIDDCGADELAEEVKNLAA